MHACNKITHAKKTEDNMRAILDELTKKITQVT